MVTKDQKVAALLNMDILVFGNAVKNNPEMAVEAWEEILKRRQQITEDEEYRDRRYEAGATVLQIANRNGTDKP